MACGYLLFRQTNFQYTAGIQIVESMPSIIGQLPTEHWQLLCCHSNLIRVRTDDCVETKFINDFKRSSTFSSSAQIIRRWQAMSENSDRRWWLQICPIDIQLTIKRRKNLEKEVDVRARRQVPVEWSNSRFSYSPEHNPSKLKPFFRRGVQIHPNKLSQRINNVNSYSAGNEVGISPKIQSTTTTTSSPTITSSSSKAFEISVPEKEEEEENTTIVEQKNNTNETPNNKSVGRRLTPLRHSRLLQFNEKTRIRLTTSQQDKTTNENIAKIKTQTTTKNFNELRKTTTPHSTDVLDYYDMYDDNFDKAKHQGNGGLLDGVNDFIQSLQDGLTLAQAAFPAKINMERNDRPGRKEFQLRIAVTHPPPINTRNRKVEETELAFSRDEASHEHDYRNLDDRIIGSFVQQSDSPVTKTFIPRKQEPIKRESSNTIESMLQMIGLCQGHPEL